MRGEKQNNTSFLFNMYNPGAFFCKGARRKADLDIFNLDTAKNYYYNQLYTLAISVPTWEGLPNEIDRSIMERILLNNGSVVFTFDEILGQYLALVLADVKKYGVDGRPVEYTGASLFGNARYTNLTPDNSVLIYDNVAQIPTLLYIDFFASRLANLRLTIDQCVKNLKVPYIIATSSNNKVAIEALLNEVYKFKPAVISDGIVDLESLKLYSLTQNIPESMEAARTEFTNTYNEALSAIGMANISQTETKAERMTALEVSKTVSGSELQQQARLKPRIQGAEKINELFGLSVEVSFTSSVLPSYLEPLNEINDEPGQANENTEGGEG